VRSESLEAFAAGAYADALEGFLHLKSVLPPEDPGLAEAHFYIAECRYGLGDYTLAVQSYRDAYKTGRADETLLNRSFQRIYEIGLDYLSGRAGQSFLFSFIRTKGPSEGIDILIGEGGLVTQYPYLPFADDALREIARYQYAEEAWDEAERLYRRVVTEYPGREWTEEAQFQLAMSVHKQIRGIAYEQKRILDAERQFRRYLEECPRGKQAEEAREKLREIAEMLGESSLEKAKFYLRESQPEAARLYLKVVLERYTTTVAAKEAREIMGQLDRSESGG
jgi:TolA-binding protein